MPGEAGIPFYTSVGCGAAAEAQKLGMKFSVQGATTFSVAAQTQVVNAVIANHPAAIMISLTDPQAMESAMQQAKQDGIKLIAIDGNLAQKGIMAQNIESDGVAGGNLAGQRLAQLIGGKGDVMMIDNAAGSPVSEARQQGFEQAIAKYPNIHNLGVKYSNNEVGNAASLASTTATTDANLAGIFTLETNNTQGAITGLSNAHKTNTVKLVGFDTSNPIVAALKSGALQGDVVQYPYLEGQWGIDGVASLLQGKSIPAKRTPPFVFATPSNVNSAQVQQYIYKTSCS